MIITCEKCSTRFTLDDSLIQPEGSKLRCSQCKHVFTAFPEEPDTGGDEFDAPVDFDFDEPAGGVDGDADDDIPFDGQGDDEELEMEFSEDDSFDFDDQEIDFGEVEFDETPDFEDKDFPESDFDVSVQEESDTDLELDDADEIDFSQPDGGLELEDAAPEPEEGLEDDLEEEPAPALQGAAPALEDSDLKLDDDDLELESLDLEIEDIEPIETAETAAGDTDEASAEFEISFAGDEDDSLTLDGGALQPAQTDMEDIELGDDLDDGLELVFEDDPEADLVFEEPSEEGLTDLEDLQEMGGSLEPEDEFESAPKSLDEEEFEPELELDAEPGAFMDEEGQDSDQEKFAEYDAVLDEDPGAEEVIPDPELEEDAMDISEAPGIDDQDEPDPDDEMLIGGPAIEDNKKAARRRSGIGAPVKILFLLFVLVIVAYIASLKLGADIPFLSQVNIPFITDALKPEPPPVVHLKPVPNEPSINGRFVSNATAGELFIVTGRIDNPAQIAYSHIKVKGTLLDKNKAKVGTQTAFCGNIIPEETLKKGNISDITTQLNNQSGLQNANVNVQPGKSVLFMLVFSNLPDNLTNFTVEVIGSKAADGKN